MNVDRRRFLALTTAIAAAHCAPQAPPTVNVPTENVDVSPTSAASSSSTAPPPEADPRAAPPAEGTFVANGPTSEGNVVPPPPRGPRVKAQACPPADNLKGHVASCATLVPPGPTCESFSDTRSQCGAIRSILKPRVAEKAVACHLAKSGTPAICQFNLVTDCATEALRSVCLEPAAVATCRGVMNKCSGDRWSRLDEDSCAAAVSAIADTHRAAFVSCITESCRFEPCFYHLGPSRETGGTPKRRPF